jgi:hypothetical protein
MVGVIVMALAPTARLAADDWEIEDCYGRCILLPHEIPEDLYYSDDHVTKRIKVNDWSNSCTEDYLGLSYAVLAGSYDGWAQGHASSTWFEYATSFSLSPGWYEPLGVKFVWQRQEPSPGVVLSWDAGGEGWVGVAGYAAASSPPASAYSGASAYSVAGGSPGDENGIPGGSSFAYGSANTDGPEYAGAYSDGYPGGNYPEPYVFYGDNHYEATAEWSFEASGQYQSSPGTTVVWAAGGGGAYGELYVSISVPYTYSASAGAYITTVGEGGYSVSASTPP